jgi:hypothetical protein
MSYIKLQGRSKVAESYAKFAAYALPRLEKRIANNPRDAEARDLRERIKATAAAGGPEQARAAAQSDFRSWAAGSNVQTVRPPEPDRASPEFTDYVRHGGADARTLIVPDHNVERRVQSESEISLRTFARGDANPPATAGDGSMRDWMAGKAGMR